MVYQWLISKKNIILQVSEGSNIFQGGVQIFSRGGGPNANFYRDP